MSRSTIAILFIAVSALMAATAFANVITPELCTVPDVVTLSPGARYGGNPIGGYTVNVEGTIGPVTGAIVEVEFSSDADALVAWCQGQTHPILTGSTDSNGDVSFEFFGGGCLDPDKASANTFSTYIVQVRADDIVLGEPSVSSPDVVDANGYYATDSKYTLCDGGTTVVGLSDAVAHTRPIKLGLVDACSKFTPPFTAAVNLDDAVFVTPYIKNSNFCTCQ